MKMNSVIDKVLEKITKNNLNLDHANYSMVQDNLYKCKSVIEFILGEISKDEPYKIDVTEYFNLIVIRMNKKGFLSYKDSKDYYDIFKKFQSLFKESGIQINLVILVGDLKLNNYNLLIED